MYKVNELGQILKVENGVEFAFGTAVEGTKSGVYDDISEILYVSPEPKPEPTQSDRIEMKLDIINLRAEGIL